MTSIDILLGLVLILLSTLYAIVLQRHERAIEPDLTAVEVVIGVALTLAFVWFNLVIQPDQSSHAVFWRTVGAFITSGTPIIVWQIWQAFHRRTEVIQYLKRRTTHGERTARVATHRQKED